MTDSDFEYAKLFALPPSKQVNAQDAIECLLEACGNIELAADKLTRKAGRPFDERYTPQQVQALCTQDLPALKKAVQADLTINLYGLVPLAIAAARAALPNLEPKEAISALRQISTLLQTLSDDHHAQLDINVNEYVNQHLPPEIKQVMAQVEAMRQLQRDEPPQLLEHNPLDD